MTSTNDARDARAVPQLAPRRARHRHRAGTGRQRLVRSVPTDPDQAGDDQADQAGTGAGSDRGPIPAPDCRSEGVPGPVARPVAAPVATRVAPAGSGDGSDQQSAVLPDHRSPGVQHGDEES